ncbi:MAG: TraR/DksA C4-type zinc finger protein [Spirochaetia bacterium]|nr:TraR/DksA C4-type zinc finger protein [Spirochaetia bacterium]
MNIADIETSLSKKRQELSDRLIELEQDIRRQKTPLDQDWEEASVQQENDQVVDTLASEIRTEVGEIDLALLRIRDGKYGICSVCGTRLPDSRLQALPYASTCVVCSVHRPSRPDVA